MIHSHKHDNNFCDIFTGVFQRDTFAQFLFIIWLGLHSKTVDKSNERK